MYAAIDAAILLPLQERVNQRADSLRLTGVVDIENRALPTIVWMELAGIGFNEESWTSLANSAQAEVDTTVEHLNQIVREQLGPEKVPEAGIQWSSPAKVQSVFAALDIQLPDTKDATIKAEAESSNHPILPLFLRYRGLSKMAGTYGKGWLKFVHPETNRIHADWKQIGAESGRMSCREPNLQNLPREKMGYRACFVAPPGRVLIKADYSQIELRLVAEMANDKEMIKAFNEGQDLHKLAGERIIGDLGNRDPSAVRAIGKVANFGLTYGMGAIRLASYAKNWGVSLTVEQATETRNAYFEAFPALRSWQYRQGKEQITRTLTGRRRVVGDKYTLALASPVQGSGADGLKLALAKLREIPGPEGAFPVLTIHDEIVIETPADKVDEAKTWLEKAMVEGMQECLTKVPVVVDIKVIEAWE